MSIRSRSDLTAAAAIAVGLTLARYAAAEPPPPTTPPLAAPAPAPNEDDAAIAHQRQEFDKGMARYQANDVRGAIDTWLPIYAELGPQRGYRLSYNLGIAYEQLGDATNAAERYESFLTEVDARRARAEAIEKIVSGEESDARARLAGLQATRGRIKVGRGGDAVEVSIDGSAPRAPGYTAYVPGGSHRVRYVNAAGATDAHTVDVAAGQLVEVAPTPVPEPPKPPPAATTATPTPATSSSAAPPATPPPLMLHATIHPFSSALLFVTGALAAVSVLAPVLTYEHAYSLRSTYASSSNPAEQANIQGDYDSARAVAYVTLAIPVALTTITAALTAWYFAGTKDEVIPTTIPAIAPVQGGAVTGITGRF